MKKILIVEDDKNLNKGLRLSFEKQFIIESAYSIKEAVNKIDDCDLILLDLNLPDGDGLDFIQKINKIRRVPIIVVSARDMEMDVISAINFGADDYITKPFSLGILQAKVNRLFERVNCNRHSIYRKKGFDFNFDAHIFLVDNKEIFMSVTEVKILYYLIFAKGMVLSRESLLEKVWGLEVDFIDSNTISVNINRLRNKLKPYDPIETVYGVGYKWTY